MSRIPAQPSLEVLGGPCPLRLEDLAQLENLKGTISAADTDKQPIVLTGLVVSLSISE